MQAVIGQEVPFDHGRQQLKLLAHLEITIKAVERTAGAIGSNIAAGEQSEIQRIIQRSTGLLAAPFFGRLPSRPRFFHRHTHPI